MTTGTTFESVGHGAKSSGNLDHELNNQSVKATISTFMFIFACEHFMVR